MKQSDIIILGAGAAGMMAAIEAGRRGRSVIVIDHAANPGQKIRISGGGRCNFTNIHCGPGNFLSQNPHFARSALAAFPPAAFIERVRGHGIAYHEKTLGQLFCDNSAKDIITMLTRDMAHAGAELRLGTSIGTISHEGSGFRVETDHGPLISDKLIVATGGKSIPKMGATGLAYDIAAQFGIQVTETRAALVPFTWASHMAELWGTLSGVSANVIAQCNGATFREAMLLTHRGLSGPAMLQVSSYWREGDPVRIDLTDGHDVAAHLKAERASRPKVAPQTVLAELLPKRLAQVLSAELVTHQRLADMGNAAIDELAKKLKAFHIVPGGTEGYRTAEVTLGGIDTAALNQKTMECRSVPGLHFIGEAVDVTGHLGGHNFQWAWASGFVAGNAA